MKTFHKIIIGDSRQMKEVPNESVHLIITSLIALIIILMDLRKFTFQFY